MADELVTIAEYPDSMQAELDRQVLEDFGIRAVVLNQNAANICLAPTLTLVKLQVLESDAVKAKEMLEEQKQGCEAEGTDEVDGMDELDEPDWSPEQEET
jgi:hypothetical protein